MVTEAGTVPVVRVAARWTTGNIQVAEEMGAEGGIGW